MPEDGFEFAVINVLCTIDLFDTTEPPSGEGTVYHFPEHLSSPRSLVEFVMLALLDFYVMFCRSLFVLFSFDHCVVCPSSI